MEKRMEIHNTLFNNTIGMWFWAVLLALLFNILLVSFIPTLTSTIPEKLDHHKNASAVDMIRIKPPVPPASEKDSPQPKKESMSATQTQQSPSQQLPSQQSPVPQNPLNRVPLPMDIKMDIPAGIGKIQLPPMQAFSVPGLRDFYSVNELDKPLSPLVIIPPLYPPRAKRRGIEGWVKIKYRVNLKGRVENIEVLDADPKNIFDRTVLRSVSSWRFSPGMVDGVPVKIRIIQRLKFNLNHD